MPKPILPNRHLSQSGRYIRILRLAAGPQPRPEKATARPASVVTSGRLTLALPVRYAAATMRKKSAGR